MNYKNFLQIRVKANSYWFGRKSSLKHNVHNYSSFVLIEWDLGGEAGLSKETMAVTKSLNYLINK